MSIEINNECETQLDEARVLNLLKFAYNAMYLDPRSELSVLFVDEEVMTTLHIEWMNEPGPTDVLSFPMDEVKPGTPDKLSDPAMLGDIVICPDYAEAGAKERGVSLLEEIEMLAVHGLLHLLGFDHATQSEEAQMFGIQDQILQDFRETGS